MAATSDEEMYSLLSNFDNIFEVTFSIIRLLSHIFISFSLTPRLAAEKTRKKKEEYEDPSFTIDFTVIIAIIYLFYFGKRIVKVLASVIFFFFLFCELVSFLGYQTELYWTSEFKRFCF